MNSLSVPQISYADNMFTLSGFSVTTDVVAVAQLSAAGDVDETEAQDFQLS